MAIIQQFDTLETPEQRRRRLLGLDRLGDRPGNLLDGKGVGDSPEELARMQGKGVTQATGRIHAIIGGTEAYITPPPQTETKHGGVIVDEKGVTHYLDAPGNVEGTYAANYAKRNDTAYAKAVKVLGAEFQNQAPQGKEQPPQQLAQIDAAKAELSRTKGGPEMQARGWSNAARGGLPKSQAPDSIGTPGQQEVAKNSVPGGMITLTASQAATMRGADGSGYKAGDTVPVDYYNDKVAKAWAIAHAEARGETERYSYAPGKYIIPDSVPDVRLGTAGGAAPTPNEYKDPIIERRIRNEAAGLVWNPQTGTWGTPTPDTSAAHDSQLKTLTNDLWTSESRIRSGQSDYVKEATSFNITKYIDPRAATSDPYVKGQIAAIAKLKTDVRAGRADPKAAYKYMVDFAKTYASSQPTREWAAEQARKEQYERQDQAAARRESMTRESWSRSDAQRQAQQEHADRLREHAQGSRTQEQDNANQLKAYQLQYRELDGAYNKANADVNYYEKQEQDIYPKLVNLKGDSQEYIRLRQLADSYMELKNSAIARRDELLKQREAVKEQIIGNLTGKAETQQQPQGGIPQVKSEEDYNALPQGSEYIAPDGTHRRKK